MLGIEIHDLRDGACRRVGTGPQPIPGPPLFERMGQEMACAGFADTSGDRANCSRVAIARRARKRRNGLVDRGNDKLAGATGLNVFGYEQNARRKLGRIDLRNVDAVPEWLTFRDDKRSRHPVLLEAEGSRPPIGCRRVDPNSPRQPRQVYRVQPRQAHPKLHRRNGTKGGDSYHVSPKTGNCGQYCRHSTS